MKIGTWHNIHYNHKWIMWFPLFYFPSFQESTHKLGLFFKPTGATTKKRYYKRILQYAPRLGKWPDLSVPNMLVTEFKKCSWSWLSTSFRFPTYSREIQRTGNNLPFNGWSIVKIAAWARSITLWHLRFFFIRSIPTGVASQKAWRIIWWLSLTNWWTSSTSSPVIWS